ncbi:uncharacterized protein N7483_000934 [Penicillium malachiteum]|uniref:uncharacterized protein n=1 Tax=Penicillium malachiteum TaxID=1324776 RepID=UPI0025473D39|nr:uncharacterized protein N7483_000934 [Penicillium malachiteum]KAJ5735809.1 hypothetical protein N7483_000934 [Penicillium malachiteum]
MDAADQSSIPTALSQLTKVPIAQLAPTVEQIEEKCIDATITLIWPYSSVRQSLSLLLSEPDFSLRSSHGTVKATFHGQAAEKLAASRVGIYENIRLSLRGSKFVANDSAETSESYIAWEIHFESALSLEIKRTPKDSESSVIFIEHDDPQPEPEPEPEKPPPSTPRVVTQEQTTWESPAFLRSGSNHFGGLLRSSLGMSAEEDGFVPGKGRKRPRYSLQRDDWHLLDEPTDPQQVDEPALDWWETDPWEKASETELNHEETEDIPSTLPDKDVVVDNQDAMGEERNAEMVSNQDEEMEVIPGSLPQNDVGMENEDAMNDDQGNVETTSREASPIFVKPYLDFSGDIFQTRSTQNDNVLTEPKTTAFQDRLILASHLPTDTPQLRPIPSPGLPIPSPIVSDSNDNQGYFSGLHNVTESVSLEANPIITAPESISFSAPSPGSPPRSTSMVADPVRMAQKDESIFTSTNLVTSQPASPIVEEQRELTGGLVLDQTEALISSESVEDIGAVGTVSAKEPIEDNFSPHDINQVPIQPAELEPMTEEIEDPVDTEMGDAEASAPEADSENAQEESDIEQKGLEVLLQAHDTLDAEEALRPREDRVEEDVSDEEVLEDNASDVSQTEMYHRRRASFSEDEGVTDNEEAIYDEENEDSTTYSEPQDEYEEDESQANDSESGREDLPRTPAQPEVIVLDSDSEDESSHNGPAISQYMQVGHATCRSSSPQSEMNESVADVRPRHSSSEAEQSEMDESVADVPQRQSQSEVEESDDEDEEVNEEVDEEVDEELGEEVDEEVDEEASPLYGESESEGEEDSEADKPAVFGQYDRVRDSDKEDESSVDVLARDHYSARYSSQRSSVEEGDDQTTAPGTEAEAMSSKGYNSEDVIKTSTNSESVIDLDSDEDEDQAPEARESTFPREDSAPASRIEKAWSTRTIDMLDGANDQDLDESVSSQKADAQAEDKNIQVTFEESTGKQLLNPDPTQASSGLRPAVQIDNDVEAPPEEDTEELSMAPDFLLPPTSGLATNVTDPVEQAAVLSHLEQAQISQGIPDEHHAGYPLVVVPSTETRSFDEQPQAARDKSPDTTTAALSQLPSPDRHAHGLRSKLSYFAPLATLIDHFGALVDTVSIVHEISPIAKSTSGSKDYFMTIQLTDPSMAGTVLQAQIFRRYKSAMPTLAEGNAVLLRDFKVRSYDHSMVLVSVESSSWAVFDGSGPDAQVDGPPVEYGSEERAYASGLRNWYSEVGASMVADHMLQVSIMRDSMDREGSSVLSETGSLESPSRDVLASTRGSRRRRSHRRVTIHELRDGRRYAEVGSPSTKESIHELRDGTVYANQ